MAEVFCNHENNKISSSRYKKNYKILLLDIISKDLKYPQFGNCWLMHNPTFATFYTGYIYIPISKYEHFIFQWELLNSLQLYCTLICRVDFFFFANTFWFSILKSKHWNIFFAYVLFKGLNQEDGSFSNICIFSLLLIQLGLFHVSCLN